MVRNDKMRVCQLIVGLRKISAIYTELPDNNSWKFVDASQMLDVDNPWNFREVVNLPDLSEDRMQENFIGVKIGDLDQSAIPNALNQAITLRERGNLSFHYDDAFVSGGENFIVELKTSEAALRGYQLGIDMTQLSLLDVDGRDLSEANYNLTDSHLVIAHHSDYDLSNGESILTLRLKAQQDGWISELLKLNSAVIRPEAYVSEDHVVRDLLFTPEDGFLLKQNVPNPFSDHTTIEYSLPNYGTVTLTLYDMAGRHLHQIEVYGQRGDNHLEISKSTIGQSGLIYYKMDYGGRTAMKRMMILE